MTLKELYCQIYDGETTKDSDRFIEIYETNRPVVENVETEKSKDEHNMLMRLKADYAHNLTLKERYTKAIPEIQMALELFESYPDFKDSNHLQIGFYETLVFDKAIANFHLRNLNDSIRDLKKLTKEFPSNDIYSNWLKTIKSYKYQKLKYARWYVFGGLMIVLTFFGEQTLGEAYIILLFIALTIFFTNVVGDLRSLLKKVE
ncbi:MAG: hypothetical protein RIC95_07190 [Vicingaceae bacterium]